MTFNNKIKVCIIFLMMFTISGCGKYLDIYNPSAVTTEYYNTKIGQEKLVVELYIQLRCDHCTADALRHRLDKSRETRVVTEAEKRRLSTESHRILELP